MNLTEYLLNNPVDNITDEIVISKRLKKFKLKIRAVTDDEFASYQTQSNTIKRHGKIDFNNKKFNDLVVINHTIDPNFKDAESIKKAGCITPEQYKNKCLLAGEVAELAQKILSLSGFDKDTEELKEEAKNS